MEIGPVRQSGEAVVTRHETDTLLRLDTGGHFVEGDDAKLVISFPRGEFEVAVVGEPHKHLAILALPQGAGELRFGIARILEAQHACSHATHEQAPQRPSQQLVGFTNAHEAGGLRIGHHHLAFGAEHYQPGGHRIERAIETLRDLVRASVADHGGEQHLPHALGGARNDEEERNDQQAQHRVERIGAHQEPDGDRKYEGQREDRHHARRAVVAAGHGDHRPHRDSGSRQFGIGIRIKIDRDEAKAAEREALNAALDDVFALAAFRAFIVADD